MSLIRNIIKYGLEKHPVVSNCIIYGTLCVSAETIQQTVNKKILPEKREPFELDIIKRYTIYGYALAGPVVSVWYRYLDRILPGTAPKIIVKKLLVDQLLFTPQLLALFYVSMSVMEHKDDPFEELKDKFLTTFKTSCLFWGPAQTLNFVAIPPVYRVAYVGACSFIWVNILCFLKRQ